MTDAAFDTITIDRRFRGPPRSGNGGYTAGRLAHYVDGPAVRVMLQAPPPLEQALAISRDGDITLMSLDGRSIALAEPCAPLSSPSQEIDLQKADAASDRYVGHEGHLCPGCFVCGPERDIGDGLRIFAGPTDEGEQVAATWSPLSDLGDNSGKLREEFMWAALDCPTYFALPDVGELALLGSMSAEIFARPRVGDRLVISAWPVSSEGRKRISHSALYAEDGTPLAAAECLWIMLKEDQFGIYDVEGKT